MRNRDIGGVREMGVSLQQNAPFVVKWCDAKGIFCVWSREIVWKIIKSEESHLVKAGFLQIGYYVV